MKVLCVTLILIFVNTISSDGKILNGYEKKLQQALHELNYLNALKSGEIHHLNGTKTWELLNETQKKNVDRSIKEINQIIQYYLLTERLINEFKTIVPDIYEEIDVLRNYDAKPTDVYIKVMPPDHELREISGATLLSRDSENKHTCVSEFGPNSVSVLVCPTKHGLKILAHELGHVKFIVPKLNEYIEYCSIRYRQQNIEKVVFNHQASDMGSKTVIEYEKRFKRAYKCYLEEGNEAYKPKLILKEIKAETLFKDQFTGLKDKHELSKHN